MSFYIDIEVVFPCTHTRRTRFETCHRYTMRGERRQHVVHCTGLVRDCQHKRGLVFAARPWLQATDDGKACTVMRVILHMRLDDAEVVSLPSDLARDRGC